MGKRDKDIVDTLRASGLRKKVAKALTNSNNAATDGKASKALRQSASRLRSVASVLEHRADESRRSEAAKKAAGTRKRNATKRSAAAKKAARPRAGRS